MGDLLRLSWSHVGDDSIVIATNKSGHRVKATIPLYDDLRSAIANIPKQSTTILTNSLGRPWSVSGFGSVFSAVKNAAGLRALHFHDLRGTAATRFRIAGLPEHVIAEMLGWEGEHVARIIRLYVAGNAATLAFIAKLNKNKT
jgi:integrase